MAKTSELGKEIKKRLVDMEKNQEWLIEQVRERTGDFFDSSYLHRLLAGKTPGGTGRNGKPGKIEVIREILGLTQERNH